jgi:transcriptional regulator with XRE-family HTH domain
MARTGSPTTSVVSSVFNRKSMINRKSGGGTTIGPTRRDNVTTARHAPKIADLKFAELGSFLAARRAEVTPEQVGLPSVGPRRLTGLRREEVAMLAGIGASWYTWIEQGRAKNVSPNVLTAIADVLGLNETQRQYVMRLAGYAPPARPSHSPTSDAQLNLSVVDGFLPNPAYFLDYCWNIIAANSTATHLLGIQDRQTNYLDMLFTDPRAVDRFPHWEQDAADAVARFRAQSAELLGDPRLDSLIAELGDKSPAFAKLWDEHHVNDEPHTTQILNHPQLGPLSMTRLALDVASRPGLQLILLSPQTHNATIGIEN